MFLIFLAVILVLISLNYPRLMDAIVYLMIAPFLGFCTGGFLWGITLFVAPSVFSLAGFGAFVVLGTAMWVVGLLAIRYS
jgi:hypothetical protein